LSSFLGELPQLSGFRMDEGTPVVYNERIFSWFRMHKGFLVCPPEMLSNYGVHPGDSLLSVRGSGLALGFLTKGPLYELALKHRNIDVF
jgi:hypothetical protein